jgi:hypothetical protein
VHRLTKAQARRTPADRVAHGRAPANPAADRPDRRRRPQRGPCRLEPPRLGLACRHGQQWRKKYLQSAGLLCSLTPSSPNAGRTSSRQRNVLICRYIKPSDSNRRPLVTMEVPRRSWRSPAATRDHVSPANRPIAACLACPRVPWLMYPSRTRGSLSVCKTCNGEMERATGHHPPPASGRTCGCPWGHSDLRREGSTISEAEGL